jgi:predicted subunit of tRNA(5-methylaminomethyl-2-thiouridylate) methyltransferase
MVEVCQQLRERDMKIIGLESRVMELDRQVIDLQVEIIVTEVN